MDGFLDQIDDGLRKRLYFLTLHAALSLPDIMSHLDRPGGGNARRYARWYDANMPAEYSGRFEGADCWQFRNAMLHEGSAVRPGSSFGRVLMLEPRRGPNLHRMVVKTPAGSALCLHLNVFCHDLLEASRGWLAGNRQRPEVQQRLASIVDRHPEGVAPFVGGAPIIA